MIDSNQSSYIKKKNDLKLKKKKEGKISHFLVFLVCSTEFLQDEEIQCLFFVDGGPPSSTQAAAFN